MNTFLGLILILGTASAHAAPVPQVKISSKFQKSDLEISVIPPEGTHLNFEAPWKLELLGQEFGASHFDQARRAFRIPLSEKTKKDSPSIDYRLVYFFCSNDNSWCRREVFNAKAEVKK